tara:strand:+ start:583 stop:1323 length:741 start_codon:yes stop_codon:yes gene_type:complete
VAFGKSKIPFQTLITFLLLVSALAVSAQEEENIDKYGRNLEELTIRKRGPNLDHYSHIFLGYGYIIGPSEKDSADVRGYKSSTFMLGYLFKWRLAKFSEIGFSATYHYSSFHLKQDSMKAVPTKQLHRKEKIVFNNIQLAPFHRIKLTNKHHSNGTFIDMGGYFGYHYRTKHQTRENNLNTGARRTRTVNLGLKYVDDFSYGLLARIGFNRIMLYARYRISNHFTPSSDLPELPRFEAGLKLGIHQ